MGPDDEPRRQPGDLPGGVLDSRPEPRGLNRLVRTGWRRAARAQASVARAPARAETLLAGRLTVELVPKTSWCADVRELVDEATWERIQRQSQREAGERCEVCGGRGPQHPVECHELWRYEDQVRVQALLRMIALCPDCHQVKHIGFASVHGRSVQARTHLARVNGWTLAQTDAHIHEAFRVWAQRSQGPWTLDLEGLRLYLPPVEHARVVRLAAIPPERRSGDR
jgi:hypothetical protein